MLTDSHIHLEFDETLGNIVQEEKINCIINCQSQDELLFNQNFENSNKRMLSAGIHPWDAKKYNFNEFENILKRVAIIGEIGFDSVWTKVPLKEQKSIFEQQLMYANKNKKPVILHTKGCEKEVLELIKKYPNRYYVHWYDSKYFIEDYLKLDCYFSIGPDISTNNNVRQLVGKIPDNKLLIETDGVESLNWVSSKTLINQDYIKELTKLYIEVAKIKQISINNLKEQIAMNFNKFVGI